MKKKKVPNARREKPPVIILQVRTSPPPQHVRWTPPESSVLATWSGL